MSDDEKSQRDPADEVPAEEAEPEEPRTTIQPQTIIDGLSKVQRTAGKILNYH